MLFKFLVLLLLGTPSSGTVHKFPGMEVWVNALDSVEKVESFLHSKAAFGRQVVTILEEEGQQKQPTLGGTYPLIQGLERIFKTRRDHQLMLVFNNPMDFKESVKSLTLMRHKWIWLYFPIARGPFSDATPINLNEFSKAELELMRDFQLAFGFTTDKFFGRGEYLHKPIEHLASLTDVWYTRLEYTTNFIVELSMHILLNSSDSARVWRPLLDRTMYISLATTSRDEQLVVRHKGTMRALAVMLGKDRLYLNVPDNVRLLLNPPAWFNQSDTSIGAILGDSSWLPVYPILLSFVLSQLLYHWMIVLLPVDSRKT